MNDVSARLAPTLRRELLAMCGVVVGDDRCDWGVIARHAHRDESLDGLRNGDVVERGARADRTAWVLRVASDAQWDAAYERADVELAAAREVGARLTTVLDEDYPLNLGFVFNLPPFLFYRGKFDAEADARSVAVVGTRTPRRTASWPRKLSPEEGWSCLSSCRPPNRRSGCSKNATRSPPGSAREQWSSKRQKHPGRRCRPASHGNTENVSSSSIRSCPPRNGQKRCSKKARPYPSNKSKTLFHELFQPND